MSLLESRIKKLEDRMKPKDDDALSLLLQALGTDGRPHAPLVDLFEQTGSEPVAVGDDGLTDPGERGLARMLLLFAPYDDIFAIERFRGLVPDRVLAAVYGKCVNWAGPHRDRVRELAGVVESAELFG